LYDRPGQIARLAILLLLILSTIITSARSEEAALEELEPAVSLPEAKDRIALRRFVIAGSTRFSDGELQEQLRRFTGRNRTRADIEAAREALETFFREQGYTEATVRIVEPSPFKSTVSLAVQENLQPFALKEPVPMDVAEKASSAPATERPEPEKIVYVPAVEKPEQGVQPSTTEKATKGEADEFLLEEPSTAKAQQEGSFTIKGFIIEGTYLFPQDELQRQVKGFTGRGRTAADVEGARDALEKFFHGRGYPAILVNIPAQSSGNRVFRLEVIENRIGNVLISGNRWFSTEKILRDVPSILPGQVLNLEELQKDVGFANRNPDFKVMPEMQAGKTPGTIDIALKVQDTLPLHGSLELNNRSSHDTTELRLNAALRYDNLWQRDHSISLQYQISPQNPDEVKVASGTYTLPMSWNREDKLIVYGVVSNSNTNSAAGYSNLGDGSVIGSRLIIPLQGSDGFFHTAVTGFDYKNFKETVGLKGAAGVNTPIQYLPVTAGYSAYLRDAGGLTSFTSGVSVIFRGAVSDQHQFENKRYKSRGNSISMTAGLERNQQLPGGFNLLAKVDGQLADQPLISNEQFSAGGVESVRGYHESEASGDSALHGVIELAAPELLKQTCKERFSVAPYLFYDMASLWVRDPLPGQDGFAGLQGAGFGMRGTLLKDLDYQADLGFPLRDTTQTKAGDMRLHFKVRYQF
jgi:hemolysin activation/secretion protein